MVIKSIATLTQLDTLKSVTVLAYLDTQIDRYTKLLDTQIDRTTNTIERIDVELPRYLDTQTKANN